MVDLFEATINQVPDQIGVAKIPNNEIVGFRLAEKRKGKVHGAHPNTLTLKVSHEVVTDETASSANKRGLSGW